MFEEKLRSRNFPETSGFPAAGDAGSRGLIFHKFFKYGRVIYRRLQNFGRISKKIFPGDFGHFWPFLGPKKSRFFKKYIFFWNFIFIISIDFWPKKVKKNFWDQVCLTLSHFLPKKKNDIVSSWLYDDCQLGFYLELTCFNLAYIFPNTVLILYISSFSGKK